MAGVMIILSFYLAASQALKGEWALAIAYAVIGGIAAVVLFRMETKEKKKGGQA